MPPAHHFEHLSLVLRDRGPARLPRPQIRPNPQTAANRQNRAGHSASLSARASTLSGQWQTRQDRRAQDALPTIPAGIPLLLRIDTALDLDALRHFFDFEVVSEQEDGFVIVAARDISLAFFQQKLADFVGGVTGSASVAGIHDLRDDPSQEERLSRILSDTLRAEWPTLTNDAMYVCDVSIACTGNWQIPKKPKRGRLSDEKWAKKEAEWSQLRSEAYDKWDELQQERLAAINSIIVHYRGEVLRMGHDYAPDAVTLPDSFTLRLKLSGRGLKDLVLNFAYVFEVVEPDDIETPQKLQRQQAAIADRMRLEPPTADAPAVCVIDSGIQEEHFWLEPAVDRPSSHCFLPGSTNKDVGDYVQPGGHGTRVAGAVLHGETIPKVGEVGTECWLQNARVLDAECGMPLSMFPPAVIREVVTQFHEGARRTRIFNHSINGDAPCRVRHMSAWAAEIDRLCHEYDVLVIQSAGNLRTSNPAPRPGIAELITGGSAYPEYLGQPSCRVANPAQSFQALTVGSVAYGRFEGAGWRSFASEPGETSAFCRCGFGMWECIKPEVVEYGGDYLRNASTPPSVSTPQAARECYPELVRSTRHGGPAFDRDEVGSSYAAPKVTRIAARLQSILPEQSALLYRGLVIQSARWPVWADALSQQQQATLLRRIGYGIPDIDRATTNTDHRTTFITHQDREISAGECHIYQVPIPDALRRPGDEFDIRIDVTLSYVAEPRRTRRLHRGYLSTWLDWLSNRHDESLEAFLSRALRDEETPTQEGHNAVPWVIRNQSNFGLPGVRRNVGTVQKDWASVKSNALPEDLCIAVRGHRGWSHDPDAAARYALAVSFDIVGREIKIYEPLRTALLELQTEVETIIEAEAVEVGEYEDDA